MSRVGKKPVALPAGVTAVVEGNDITVKGPKGELKQTFRPEVSVSVDASANQIVVVQGADTRTSNAMHGLFRALIQNMVVGVSAGYEKKLEIFGTGYLAAISGNVLQVRVGFANEIHKEIPAGLTVKCPDQQHIVITGCDKQLVGQFAAEIRAIKKAEPYLGKGIKYEGEAIRRKESKAAGKK
ncbi:MAG: 50S ribosomal protein L6 [Planctomycetia bacterium]|nr:50S ribosomal protein L6 [Planctomycetia bacterium]